MYSIEYTNRFKKDLQLCQRRGMDVGLIKNAISILQETGTLPPSYKAHKLTGNHAGQCAILNRIGCWYGEQHDQELRLLFLYTGTHSDIFKK